MKLKLLTLVILISTSAIIAKSPEKKERYPATGMLYFASYGQADNMDVIKNPYIIGALFTIYWSEVETEKGVFNWDVLDQRIKRWTKEGKKAAIRIMWVSSGNWPDPVSGTPAPAWVWKEGAKYVFHPESKTEIPLIWDPIYRKNAMNFQRAVNEKYGKNPDILFIDVTPGAETNPYRFRRIDLLYPEFRGVYENTQASDGRCYSGELWLETVTGWIKETASIFTNIPCLVTLNTGSLQKENNFQAIGQCAVDNGMYVGQNGIKEGSYLNSEFQRSALYKEWSSKTKLFFEMVDAAGIPATGSLQGVMEAAERVNCDYLNVYAVDVKKATRSVEIFDPAWEEAVKYGWEFFNKKNTTR